MPTMPTPPTAPTAPTAPRFEIFYQKYLYTTQLFLDVLN
jgi:hypothetical protein